MSLSAMLPSVCKCVALAGVFADNSVVCSQCGAKRANLSPTTRQFLAGIATQFGEPAEPIVFRRPIAAKRIEQQDAQLKRKLTPTGKSHYDIITDTVGDQNVRADNEDGRSEDQSTGDGE
jgi:hypothetical protein